ncbi:MAG: hypothetical protein CMA60_00315 [Euryarchaeota archaeon]|mgnify:CR=1 FL=1|nr:hypothetical protein [Euryarchaeota archaeon]|tara:strand:+ start:12825 stop:13061 length:237 start_codon:yes stop_codon:yes gene_type:complete
MNKGELIDYSMKCFRKGFLKADVETRLRLQRQFSLEFLIGFGEGKVLSCGLQRPPLTDELKKIESTLSLAKLRLDKGD